MCEIRLGPWSGLGGLGGGLAAVMALERADGQPRDVVAEVPRDFDGRRMAVHLE
jgi:hypothetical protein